MTEQIKVMGMVLSVLPVGEFDKRVVILTRERGKIHGFARGVRRQGNSLMAAIQPFVFGEFTLIEGRHAYTVLGAKVQNYFQELREDMTATCYGCYFLELADYYGRENADDGEMLRLLYQTMRALGKKTIDYPLIRCIFELRLIAVNGEEPRCFECVHCRGTKDLSMFSVKQRGMLCKTCADFGEASKVCMTEAAVYTVQYILSSPIQKLYTFRVSQEVLECLQMMMRKMTTRYIDKKFCSLDVLELME